MECTQKVYLGKPLADYNTEDPDLMVKFVNAIQRHRRAEAAAEAAKKKPVTRMKLLRRIVGGAVRAAEKLPHKAVDTALLCVTIFGAAAALVWVIA